MYEGYRVESPPLKNERFPPAIIKAEGRCFHVFPYVFYCYRRKRWEGGMELFQGGPSSGCKLQMEREPVLPLLQKSQWLRDLTEEGVERHPGPAGSCRLASCNVGSWFTHGKRLPDAAAARNVPMVCLQEANSSQSSLPGACCSARLQSWQLRALSLARRRGCGCERALIGVAC